MPYNKGDFTQQGINGDVSALVRLNEKRVMKVVLSSDDESDNCDISGKVYDLLNGTSYDIGSGGGSGGDDVPVTTLTIINDTEYTQNLTYLPADTWIALFNGTPLEPNEEGDFILTYANDGDMTFSSYGSVPTADFDINDITGLDNITVVTDVADTDTLWILSITDPSKPSARTVKLSYMNM